MFVSWTFCLAKLYISQAMCLQLTTDASIYTIICTDRFDSCLLVLRPSLARRLHGIKADFQQTMR